jgi:hypothetical protein
MNERALIFGESGALVGVVSEPGENVAGYDSTGIILLNAGILHHVGPNRIHVKIARQMAKAGLTVLRFDFSGIGDSAARTDGLPFERSATREIQEAMDSLSSDFGIQRFIVGGFCSGAVTAFKAACSDHRVVGVFMINAQEFVSDDVLGSYIKNKANVNYYWKTALVSRSSWSKLLRGQIQYRSLVSRLFTLLGKRLTNLIGGRKKLAHITAPIRDNFKSLMARNVDLLLIYANEDPGLTELELVFSRNVERVRQGAGLPIEIVDHTDHTFTSVPSQIWLVDRLTRWSLNIACPPLSVSSASA